MNTRIYKPVIFLAFANDRDDTVRYLRNLPAELRQIRAALGSAKSAGLCELVERANATIKDILEVFQYPEYRNRIAIFHYGGHANGYQLLLESPEGKTQLAHAGGLAAFLGQQRGLQLVFLNGCSTQQQVQGLLQAQAPAVIATSQAIDDTVATAFATQFYQGLAAGDSIRVAYNKAVAAIQMEKGDNPRHLYAPDLPKEDRWPWELYLNEGAKEADAWNLPAGARDPLFGLPKLQAGDLPPKPYQHLHRFTRKHAEVFFGRGRQIRELYDLVTTPYTAPIILLYGQSGVGKSSLLEAGLMPRLESSHAVCYRRRKQEIGLLGTLFEALGAAEEMTVAPAWFALENEYQKSVIAILDQVEEVYTRPNSNLTDELQKFLEALKATFSDSAQRPQGKLILGFRKEWLAEMEKRLTDHDLFHTKVFLERLDHDGIIEAITGPARVARLQQHYKLRITDGLAEIIADDLLEDRDSPLAPTLQILLTKMWDEATRLNRSQPHFDHELYNNLKRQGILLRDFLNQQLDALRLWQPEVVDSGLALDVLAYHTTPIGSAEQWTSEQLEQEYSHRKEVLPALVQMSKDLYLLSDPAADRAEKGLATATRLAHDTLGPLIRKLFGDSDKPGQRAHRILENRSVEWRDGRQGTSLDEHDLSVVEQGAPGMRAWKPDEQRLIEASKKRRAQNQYRRKILLSAGITAVLLILISAGVAWWQRGLAKEKEAIATSRQLAAQALNHLNDQLDLALLLSVEAYQTANTREALSSLLKGLQFRPYLNTFLHGHTGSVVSVAFSPDGKILTSGSNDDTIILWDVNTHQQIDQPLTGHHWGVKSVAFSPNGKILASGSADSTIILWDVTTHQQLGPFLSTQTARVESVAFSPDGKILASGNEDNTILLWDVVSRQPLGRPLSKHRDYVSEVAFSSDGKILASGSADSTIILWDVATRKPLGQPLRKHTNSVLSVAFSPNGKILASGSGDKTIILWDVASRLPLGQSLTGHKGAVLNVAFSSDGRILASGSTDSTIMLWDIANRRPLSPPLTGHQSFVYSVAFSSDGKTLVSGSAENTIILWNIVPQQPLSQYFIGHNAGVSSVAFNSDSKTLASGSYDSTVVLWDVASCRPYGHPLKGHKGRVESVAFSAEDKTLASSSDDSTIILWDVATQQPLGQPLNGHQGGVSSVAFSPEGKTLASGSNDSTIILWNIATRQPLGKPLSDHNGWIRSVAFSPNGKTLASGSSDGTIILWDVTTQQPKGHSLTRYTEWGMNVAFSPDGKILAAGSLDNTIIVLKDIKTPQPLGQFLSGHKNAVWSVAFSPDGTTLASGSLDNTIILWDVTTIQQLGLLLPRYQGQVWSVMFSPDGKTLASGSNDGTIILWDVSFESWQARACKIANRNLMIDEWRQYVDDNVLSYRRTCPDLPIHPSFIEYGKQLARTGDVDGTIKIFKRAKELDPSLNLDPKAEAQKLAAEGRSQK
jgi:WD40 repeat protein